MTPYTISLLVPGLPFNENTLETAPLGGSETAGLSMAYALAEMGHRVMLFCQYNGEGYGTHRGVTFLPIEQWLPFAQGSPHDVCIVERNPTAFGTTLASKLNICWMHDLPLGRQAPEVGGSRWNIDEFFVLSEFMEKKYRDTYHLDDKQLWRTRNGVDFRYIDTDHWPDRDMDTLVWAARPERGLDVMARDIMPKIIERRPDVKLHIYGYNNLVDHMKGFYDKCNYYLSQIDNNIVVQGGKGKPDLYRAYKNAALMVYPTPSPEYGDFREVSCISAMEAQLCGLPIVTTANGALVETVDPKAGVLLEPGDNYVNRFVDATLGLLEDKARWKAMSKAGREASKEMSWAKVAEEWSEHFDYMFARRNDNMTRLAYHFYRRNDIYASMEALREAKSDNDIIVATEQVKVRHDHEAAAALERKIQAEYAFAFKDKRTLKEHYAKHGRDTDVRLEKNFNTVPAEKFNEAHGEPRFNDFIQFLNDEVATVFNVLDYGCGHGWEPITLHNATNLKIHGFDIDPGAVKWCDKFAKKFARNPERLKFTAGDVEDLPKHEFDCAIASEVLEHCTDPIRTLQQIEDAVKPGGWVVLTVPYGPSEYGTYNWEHFRNHLWELDYHDLNDILHAKKDLKLRTQALFTNDKTGEMTGYFFVSYRADHKPLGKINWERKLTVQNPRQTVSVNIMCGPNASENLEWTLKSIRWVADEIILLDNDMGEECWALAKKYHCRVIEGLNPLEHGFAAARNRLLKKSCMDWVFWIDSDEHLVDAYKICKYLKYSDWDALSLHQHHFAIDTSFKIDKPARLFRNHNGIEFYGFIHEHPEKGLNDGPGKVLILSDGHLAHVGYLTEDVRRRRFDRNFPLLMRDRAENPDRKFGIHLYMRDLMLLCMYDYEKEGTLTPGAREKAKEVLRLYDEHFKNDPAKFIELDTMQFVTQALTLLNEGIDVTVDVRVNRDGQGDQLGGGQHIRVRDTDDAVREINNLVKAKLERYDVKDW